MIIARFSVVLIAFAVFGNTLDGEFAYDDIPIIVENPLITELSNIVEIFKTNYWRLKKDYPDKRLYRPLTITSYSLNYAFHQLRPFGYHLVNVALHAIVCWLFFELILGLFGGLRLALYSALLFSVHPIHTEVVANVVGRSEILSLLGTILCLCSYHQVIHKRRERVISKTISWSILSIAAYAIAVFSKEIGIVAPALIIMWEILRPDRRFLLWKTPTAIGIFLGYAAVALLFLILRSNAIPDDPPALAFANVSNSQRVYTALRICLEYVGLLLCPLHLSAKYSIDNTPIALSPIEPGVMAAVVILVSTTLFIVIRGKKSPAVSWGLGMFVITLIPASNIFFPIGLAKAERILYTPSAGFLIAVSAILCWLGKKGICRVIVHWGVAAMLVLFFFQSWNRNTVWHTNYTLAQATLAHDPNNSEFNKILGFYYQENKQYDKAKSHLLKSFKVRPHWNLVFNLGLIAYDEGKYLQALQYYEEALRLDPNNVKILNNKSAALMKAQKLSQATRILQRIIMIEPDHSAAYQNLVRVYVMQKDLSNAIRIAELALQRFPTSSEIHYDAAKVYEMAGEKERFGLLMLKAKELKSEFNSDHISRWR